MAFTRQSALDLLTEAHRAGRLAHAYLFTGAVGSGKAWLATELAARVLDCPSQDVHSHPDAYTVQPESKSRRIVTEQMRQLEHAIQRKPLLGANKVAIIHEADRLQPQAANAFLKTLEEPPPGSLIILLSALPEAMLETILSRCVETSLQGGGNSDDADNSLLWKALEECLIKPAQPGAADAFRFTRAVQGVLAIQRERISDEYETSLKEDTARYKQTSDSATWLDERAEQTKALTEAGVLRERERVLQTISDAFGSALRAQHGFESPIPVIQSLSTKFPAENLLRRLDALENLRRRLAMGVQEALALEAGFLKMTLTP